MELCFLQEKKLIIFFLVTTIPWSLCGLMFQGHSEGQYLTEYRAADVCNKGSVTS